MKRVIFKTITQKLFGGGVWPHTICSTTLMHPSVSLTILKNLLINIKSWRKSIHKWSVEKHEHTSCIWLSTCDLITSSLMLIQGLNAAWLLPLIMKLPVVKYSPVGAVLDTCNKQHKQYNWSNFKTRLIYNPVLELKARHGSPGYDGPTKRWWSLWHPKQHCNTQPLFQPHLACVGEQAHLKIQGRTC